MAQCSKCLADFSCGCSLKTCADGSQCCEACFAVNQVQLNAQAQPVPPIQNTVGIKIESITYSHNYI